MGKDKEYDWTLGPDELPVCLKDMTVEEVEAEIEKELERIKHIKDPSELGYPGVD